MAKVEFFVGFARVSLVYADQFSVPWIHCVEASCCVCPFKNHIISAALLQEVCHLKATRSCTQYAVVMVV